MSDPTETPSQETQEPAAKETTSNNEAEDEIPLPSLLAVRIDSAEHASLVSATSSPVITTDKQASATVTVILKPTGDVPILKNTTYKVEPTKTIGSITEFIRGKLRFQKSDSLFVFVSQCFAPAPDQVVKNILECFGVDGKIVLHYSRVQAWG